MNADLAALLKYRMEQAHDTLQEAKHIQVPWTKKVIICVFYCK